MQTCPTVIVPCGCQADSMQRMEVRGILGAGLLPQAKVEEERGCRFMPHSPSCQRLGLSKVKYTGIRLSSLGCSPLDSPWV